LIRVSIIAPSIAVRTGLRTLLSDDPQINVIAEAARLAELAAELTNTDVIVWAPASTMDLATVGIEVSKLKPGEMPALLLVQNDPKALEHMPLLSLTAWGLLDQEATQAELIASLQALNEGLSVTNPVWMSRMLKNGSISNDGSGDLVETLTGREVEILQLLALGLTNKQIASRLGISAHTVKFHVSTIFSKLGTTNRVETVNLGLKKGLIVL
jgi:two-component system, NarL family, response regulator YdfI